MNKFSTLLQFRDSPNSNSEKRSVVMSKEQVENGKDAFKKRFSRLIGADRFEWNSKANFDNSTWGFEVIKNKIKINKMHVTEADLADFGAGGPEEFRMKLLQDKKLEFERLYAST